MNWISDPKNIVNQVSTNDKLTALLKIGYKLVLVQFHELERIKVMKNRTDYTGYIGELYQHYIVEGKPKTYLCN